MTQPAAQPVQQPVWSADTTHQPQQPAYTDPYDSMAPVVGDMDYAQAQGQWQSWNGNGAHHDETHDVAQAPQYVPAPHYPASQPEPATIGATSEARPDFAAPPRQAPWNEPFPQEPAYEQPVAPAFGGQGAPSWDDTGQSPPAEAHVARPEQTWSASQPADPMPAAPPSLAPEFASPAPQPVVPDPTAPPAPQPTPAHQPAPEPPVISAIVPTQPEPQPAPQLPAPQPAAPQTMVVRIELAIVDERVRVSPAETARRVGPAADVDEEDERPRPRHPEFEPRNRVAPEPQPAPRPDQWEEPRRDQWQQPQYTPPPSAWQQAAPAPRQPAPGGYGVQPNHMDWDLPSLQAPAQPPQPPMQQMQQMQPTPQPPMQQMQPAAPRAPAWPSQSIPDPLSSLPAAAPYAAPTPTPTQFQAPGQYVAPAQYAAPAPYQAPAPYPPAPAYDPEPTFPQPVPQPQAPAAGSRARTGMAVAPTADTQADLWFLSNQPATALEPAVEDEPTAHSSSLMTAGLTVGFAILVIVLVLVFIQLMTSLLR